MRTILFLLSFLPAVAYAQELKIPEATYPTLPESGNVLTDFVPKGWKNEVHVSGDLNKDGIDDVAMILHESNPKNIFKNYATHDVAFDTNPRILVVLFGNKGGGYSLLLDNHTLIPRSVDPSLSDVINGVLASGIEIKRGSLRIKLGVFPLSASEFTILTYTFRWNNKQFELIGYDEDSRNRATSETQNVSVNFPTQKIKLVCGNENSENADKIKWLKLAQGRSWTIDSIEDSLDFAPWGTDVSCE
jgi:hypothetical protein